MHAPLPARALTAYKLSATLSVTHTRNTPSRRTCGACATTATAQLLKVPQLLLVGACLSMVLVWTTTVRSAQNVKRVNSEKQSKQLTQTVFGLMLCLAVLVLPFSCALLLPAYPLLYFYLGRATTRLIVHDSRLPH